MSAETQIILYYLFGGLTVPLIVLIWTHRIFLVTLLFSKNIGLAAMTHSYLTDERYVGDPGFVVAGFLFGTPIVSFVTDLVLVPIYIIGSYMLVDLKTKRAGKSG